MELHPIVRASTTDAVYDQLVGSILAGEVAPGEALPSERRLAEALGVSRPVVREALQRLRHAGLLDVRHGGSTRVTDFRRSGGPALLAHLLTDRDGVLDLTVARAIIEARAALGPSVAAAAAERRDAAALGEVERQLATLADATGPAEQQARSLDLWDAVVDAADNVVYRLLFNALRAAYEPVMEALAVLVRDEVADFAGHAAVVGHVRAGDAAAARASTAALVARGTTAALDAIDLLLTDPEDRR